MSKSDQKQAKQQANTNIAQNNSNAAAVTGMVTPVMDEAKATASSLLPSVVGGYTDIQSGGGYDPAIMGSINTAYSDLMSTGGISEADASAMRSRASEAGRAAYDVAASDAARKFSATGGYGGTSGAILGSLARGGSQAAERATVDADATIAGMKTGGKIAGAQGLANVQQNVVQNKLAATGGLGNVYGLNLNEVNATVDQILRNYQQTGQLNNQDLTILTNLANQPGVFDKIVGTIGTLGGAAAGVIGAVKGTK